MPRPSAEDLPRESLVGHGRHLGVEGQEVEALDAQRLQRAGHLARRHQAEGSGVGLEPAARMGVEADDGERRIQRSAAARAEAMTA